jgi:hypothetical protein
MLLATPDAGEEATILEIQKSPKYLCACIAATDDIDMVRDRNGQIPLDDFVALRNNCSALRDLLLPEPIWAQFLDWHSLPDDVANHASVALLAFRRGQLSRITGPIHRFLVSSGGIRPDVRAQYVQDLKEKWMFQNEPHERNRLYRTFRGRLVELQFASFLESESHTIARLEATGKGPDIESISANGESNAIEVKFIGIEDPDFMSLVKSISGQPEAYSVSPYQAINYLLFRVFEAARQLDSATGRKTAVIVIDGMSWWRFDLQVKENWIDWKRPKFIRPDDALNNLLSHQKRYGGESDLIEHICRLDSIQIFRQNDAFEFLSEGEYVPK